MQFCEERTTSTLESKRNNEELNDLFLPLPLPVLFLLNITWCVASFLPSWKSLGNFPTSSTDGGSLPWSSMLSSVITTSRREIISGLPLQEFYTQIYSLSLSFQCRENPVPLHGLNNLESHQIIHSIVEIISLEAFVRNCMNFGFILVSNQYTLSQN